MAAEIDTRLGPGDVVLGHREVRFSTGPAPALPALRLASADDVFLRVGEGERVDHTRASLATIREVAHALPWAAALSRLARLRPGAGWPAFSVSASSLGRRNFSRYEIEDHVAEGAAAALGLPYRPTRAPVRPGTELSIRVHLVDGRVTFALRVFDRPLHRRPYKRCSCVGTLHPPLAAAMAMVAGLRPGVRVLDPFAGVGTVAIEARLLQPRARTVAADLDEARLRGASVNARAAGVSVGLARADGVQGPWSGGAFGRVVSNLPWERAVPYGGGLAHAPPARRRELARVLNDAGRAVLLVHQDDPLGLDRPGRPALTLLHRSWVSVFGQQPRLCVLAREGAAQGGAIDAEAPWGPALARRIRQADTAEPGRAGSHGVAHETPGHPPWRGSAPGRALHGRRMRLPGAVRRGGDGGGARARRGHHAHPADGARLRRRRAISAVPHPRPADGRRCPASSPPGRCPGSRRCGG